jgi:hypothetical protein
MSAFVNCGGSAPGKVAPASAEGRLSLPALVMVTT